MKNLKIYLTISSLFFMGLLSPSFSQTGTIKGKISSAQSGEGLIGASVLIKGTSTGAATDLEGNYTLNQVKPGTYSLIAQYISFNNDTIHGVKVEPGKITWVNFNLNDASIAKNEITITAKANKASENYMLKIQKNSVNLMDALSAQQMSKAGDGDAAGAIKRVTGISVEGGKYVYVRGLSDRYSKTTLNGAEIPGLDPNRNSVQMDLFPTNLLDNIVVIKTFTPDLPGSFTGGLVDIRTRDFPDKLTLQFSSSIGVNTNTTFNDKFLKYEGGKLDFLGMDDGTRDIPAKAKGNIPVVVPSGGTTDPSNRELAEITRSFNKQMALTEGSSFINHSHSFSVGNQKNIFGKPFGFLAGITYSRNYSGYSEGYTGRYSLSDANSKRLNPELGLQDREGKENILWGAITSLSYRLNNNHKISLNLLHNHNGTSSARFQTGNIQRDNLDEDFRFQTRSLWYTERALSSAQLIGEHTLAGIKNLKTTWLASYTLSRQDEPDLRFFSNSAYLDQSTENDTIFEIRPSEYSEPTRYFRNMTEHNLDLKLNFELPLKSSGKIKWGVSNNYKERDFSEKRYNFTSVGLRYQGDISNFLRDENMEVGNPNGYIYAQDATELRNNYTSSTTVRAAYGMVEFSPLKKLKVITGARVESASIFVSSAHPDKNSYPDARLENLDILPSLNTTYEINEKSNLRFGYSRTLARPNFRELAPFASFDFVGDFLFVGNPELERTLIDNLDLRWEIYPNVGEIISFSIFHKRFHNPIERTFNISAPNPEFTLRNVENAIILGGELEVRKKLSFLTEKLKDLSAGTNFTYVYSRVDIDKRELSEIRVQDPSHPNHRVMFGQSPYIFNTFLNFDNKKSGIEANLSFNVSGPKLAIVIEGGTPNVFEQPRGSLDFKISREIGKFIFSFNAGNLLNPEYKWSQTYKNIDYIFQKYQTGRTFSAGVKYRLQ